MPNTLFDFLDEDQNFEKNKNFLGTRTDDKDSDAWFTPVEYIYYVKQVMEGIDLDPFSCDEANLNVGATRYFTKENSAFSNIWFAEYETQRRVFMNPPYSRNLFPKAIDLFIYNFTNYMIDEAIVLTNNSTETKSVQTLLAHSFVVCFPGNRIQFYTMDDKDTSENTRGQIFYYFGSNRTKFIEVFGKIGVCK